MPDETMLPGDSAQVAVLWHKDSLGQVHIMGVFESEQEARALIEEAHGTGAFEGGKYHLDVRPITKSRNDWRLWP